jgi:tRNA threonylcarbamoyladenosine biosynthesis protein TsaB
LPDCILAIDTSLAGCSVAVWRDGAVVAERFVLLGQGHAEALIPMVAELLEGLGALPPIDCVAACVGPGSFTGVRVGVSAAKAFALAYGAAEAGVTSLQALAYGCNPTGGLTIAIDARNAQVYAQAFDGLVPLSAPALMALEDAAALAIAHGGAVSGSGADRLCEHLADLRDQHAPSLRVPKAAWVAQATADGRTVPLTPLYIRAPDALPPKRNPLLAGRT